MKHVILHLPHPRLTPFVSHYWLSRDNPDSLYPVVPDGCVDVVIESTGSAAQSVLYGTTTERTDIPVTPGGHYLGVRFKPGQSRHFIDTPARELTDAHLPTSGLLGIDLDRVAERVHAGDVFAELDEALAICLERHPRESHRVDDAIQIIEASRGRIQVELIAEQVGLSRRHLQRLFLEHVGISPKYFARIQRCRWAMYVLTSSSRRTLADVAFEMGYADQSHMTRDLKLLTGETPLQVFRGDVPFVQDMVPGTSEVGRSDTHSSDLGAIQ